jgi:hypothetical protein
MWLGMALKYLKVQFLLLLIFSGWLSYGQVGINTTTPLSTLDINGNLSVKTVTLTGSSSPTLIEDGVYISIAPQATDQEFRLPDPTLYPGRIYIIRNIQNSITAMLTTTAGLLFPKNSTTGSAQIYMLEGSLRSVIVISDGANWTYLN